MMSIVNWSDYPNNGRSHHRYLREFRSLLVYGDRRSVKACLAQHPSLANHRFDGWPALLFAQQNENDAPGIIQELEFYGANINDKDGCGNTPLHAAVRKSEAHLLPLVRELLEAGSDLTVKDGSGRTPLELACFYHTTKFMVPPLLEYAKEHSDPNLCGISDGTPLELFDFVCNASAPGHRTRLNEFLGVDSSLANARLCGIPILKFAFDLGLEDIFEDLLNHGADPNARDDDGRTLLERFFNSCHAGGSLRNYNGLHLYYSGHVQYAHRVVPLVGSHLHHGGNLSNQGVGPSYDPLHAAVLADEPTLVRLLLEHQVDVNAPNSDGKTPLYLASEILKKDLSSPRRRLQERGVANMVGPYIPRRGNPDIVQLLLEGGADVNCTRLQSGTLLHQAVESSHVALVKLLLQHRADVNATDSTGDTPSHLAVALPDSAILRLLIEHEPNVMEARNNDGENPLHIACHQSHVKAIGTLLWNGADVSTANNLGNTPLHNAVASECPCSEQRFASVTSLLERGADINVRNAEHVTALALACERGDLDILYILIRLSPQDRRPQPGMIESDNVPTNSNNSSLSKKRKITEISEALENYPPQSADAVPINRE